MTLSGINKNGAYATKEDKRKDIVFGIRKNLEIGNYLRVELLEKELMADYGMTAEQIENEVYA